MFLAPFAIVSVSVEGGQHHHIAHLVHKFMTMICVSVVLLEKFCLQQIILSLQHVSVYL
jgi:hypothetical protein